jgi:hypothetical protein
VAGVGHYREQVLGDHQEEAEVVHYLHQSLVLDRLDADVGRIGSAPYATDLAVGRFSAAVPCLDPDPGHVRCRVVAGLALYQTASWTAHLGHLRFHFRYRQWASGMELLVFRTVLSAR